MRRFLLGPPEAGFHIHILVNFTYAELQGTIDFSRAILAYTPQRKRVSFAPVYYTGGPEEKHLEVIFFLLPTF